VTGPTTPDETDIRLLIAVATFKRPVGLSRLLEALARMTLVPLNVLIVDNDPDASASSLPAAATRSTTKVVYLHEPRPGIAAARNAALSYARQIGYALLAFIDDDESPHPAWLELLLDTINLYPDSAAISGPVVSRFDDPPAPWILSGGFFSYRRLSTGTQVAIAETNNILLNLPECDRLGLAAFDDRFGISGGSDYFFTHSITSAGGKITWCDEALVYEYVPPRRTSIRWLFYRALRSANTTGRAKIVYARDSNHGLTRMKLSFGITGLMRVALGAGALALGFVARSDHYRGNGIRLSARGAGFLLASLEIAYIEYSRSGDRFVRFRNLV
jgi:succinoglycan biosynthesis protein ExoM